MFPRCRMPSFILLLLSLLGLGGCDTSAYHRSGGQWRHGDVAFTPEDPATFQALDSRFARDAKRGYFLGAAVAGSDGASFAVVSENEARDKQAVYYCDTYRKGQEYWSILHLRMERIEGADAASYAAIGKGHARDARRVYFRGRAFDVKDVASFEPLDGDFGRDAQSAYYARIAIAGSHGPSFEIIDDRDMAYARDRERAYATHDAGNGEREAPQVRRLRTQDPAAMRVLGRGYAADVRQVWYRGQVVRGADAGSFASDTSYASSVDATDRSGNWQQGRRAASSP